MSEIWRFRLKYLGIIASFYLCIGGLIVGFLDLVGLLDRWFS